MSEKSFQRDQELQAVYYNNCEEGYRVGKSGVMKIFVVMENGQMAGVPWACIEFSSGETRKLNLALCNEVIVN